jgi:peptide/nickel transport system ATP-binding protein
MAIERNEDLLRVDRLTKAFTIRQGLAAAHFVAVSQATFTMRSDTSEIFTLAGESGSGKTTLARMILGLEAPTDGRIEFRGQDVTLLIRQDRRGFMKQVQPIFQDPYATFSPLKKIETYLYDTVRNYQIAGRADAGRCVDEALQAVGLSLKEIGGRYPNELSGGQVQRISVARALITSSSLLVADEPVSMLDASLRMSVVNLFRKLKEEKRISIIYITHDLATAYYAADRIAIMLRGWVVEMGPVENVLGRPLHPYTQILKQSVPQADPDKGWHDKTTLVALETEEYLRAGCRFAGRCPQAMDVCRQVEPKDVQAKGRTVRCHLYPSGG